MHRIPENGIMRRCSDHPLCKICRAAPPDDFADAYELVLRREKAVLPVSVLTRSEASQLRVALAEAWTAIRHLEAR